MSTSKGWAVNNNFYNGKKFYDYTLPLGYDYGGPLFIAHYSFLGLDPHGLKDQVCRLLGAKSKSYSNQSLILHRQSKTL